MAIGIIPLVNIISRLPLPDQTSTQATNEIIQILTPGPDVIQSVLRLTALIGTFYMAPTILVRIIKAVFSGKRR